MHNSFGSILTKAMLAIAGLALVGLLIKLALAALQPLLPPTINAALGSGFAYLSATLGPALGPLGALAILALLIWILISSGRR